MVETDRTQEIWHLRMAYWICQPTHAQAHACARASTLTHPPDHTTPKHTRARRTHARIRMLSPLRARAHTPTEICSTYCFSTATVVTRTRLNVALHVHCLSCCIQKMYIFTKYFPVVSDRQDYAEGDNSKQKRVQ